MTRLNFKIGAAAIALTSALLATAGQAQTQSANRTTYGPDAAPASSATPSPSSSQSWRISLGGNYSTGDYGDPNTTQVYSVPLALRYSRGNFNIRVSVPFVRITGPGSLIDTPQGRDGGFNDFGGGGDDNGGSGNSGSGNSGSGNSGSGSSGSGSGSGSGSSGSGGSGSSGSGGSGSSGSGSSGSGGGGGNSGSGGSGSSGGGSSSGGGGSSTGGTGTTGGTTVTTGFASQNRSGLGDVAISAGYSLPLGGDFFLDGSARVKLPTASRSKRLGTGEVDVTLGLDLARDFDGGSIYAGARRKFAGDSATINYRDVWGAGAGVSLNAAPGVTVGADYDWQQSSQVGGQASQEVTGWASFRLTRAFRLQIFGSTGFNQASTDFAGGATISYRF